MGDIRVLCVDDNADVLGALSALLRRTPGVECVGTLVQADDLGEHVQAQAADVVLLDLRMPGADPLAELQGLVASGSPARVIILSGDVSDTDACILAGASACLAKDSDPGAIIRTILEVAPVKPV